MTCKPRLIGWEYEKVKELLKDEALPAMIVDVTAFLHNAATLAALVAPHPPPPSLLCSPLSIKKRTIRLATKSVRVPSLIRRCLQAHPDVFKGLMCYSVHEALFLSTLIPEEKDILIAYPCVHETDIQAAWQLKSKHQVDVCLMVDCVEHVRKIDVLWSSLVWDGPNNTNGGLLDDRLAVCVDVDVSQRFFGLHIGVHR